MTDLPEILEIVLPGGVPLELRRIPAGRFRMGQRGKVRDYDLFRWANTFSQPVHLVEIPEPFYLGTFPVTREQYRAIAPLAGMDPDPRYIKGLESSERCPVKNVSWHEVMAVCLALAEADFFDAALIQNGLNPKKWQPGLPSEAMWEYACRAGTETDYWSGDGEAALAEVGWYGGNSDGETHPVGQLPANPWGLHDMHGNVEEWCADVWDMDGYRTRVDGEAAAEAINLLGDYQDRRSRFLEVAHYFAVRLGPYDDYDPQRVSRGTGRGTSHILCRSASRNYHLPWRGHVGFRLCVFKSSLKEEPETIEEADFEAQATISRDAAKQAPTKSEASEVDLSAESF